MGLPFVEPSISHGSEPVHYEFWTSTDPDDPPRRGDETPGSARVHYATSPPPASRRSAGHAPKRAPAVSSARIPQPTVDHGGHGLDDKLPLAAHHFRGVDLNAIQAEQPRRRGSTVLTHLGPPSCRHQASASYARSQVPFRRLLRHPQQHTASRSMTKSRQYAAISSYTERSTSSRH